jgi:hypothetical protein
MINAAEAFKSEYLRSLKNRPEDVLPIDELDTQIHQVRQELGAFVMAATLRQAVQIGLAADRACPCGGTLSIHRRPQLRVQTMQGRHEEQGVALRCPSCGQTRRPTHERLGIQGYSKTSTLFDRLAADFFLDKGAPTVVKRFQEHHGITPGRTTVLRHVEARGKQARAFLDAKLASATAKAETKRGHKPQVDAVFVQMDSSAGKTVSPLRRPTVVPDADVERTPVRGLPKAKRPIEGKQVKLLCAQAQGAVDWVYDAYIGEYEKATDKLLGLAACCGWQDGVQTVMVADGDEKIREVAEGAFQPDLQMVLDQQHAIAHLRNVVTYGQDAVPETTDSDWVSTALDKLRAGEVADVIAQIRAIATEVGDDRDRRLVENVAIYFQKRSDAVAYDEFKAKGWPQGSGAVEGGHIHMMHPITKRGAGWLRDHLNHTIALACVRESGWWGEFWQSAQPPALAQAPPVKAAA